MWVALRQRLKRWIAERTPRQPGPVQVHRKRIYIVPTRFGYGFALLLLVMLMGAMNYSNSMAFALTFLLAGLALLSMHHTHANLLNLRVSIGPCAPIYCGETAQFEVQLYNPSPSARYSISVGWPSDTPTAALDLPPQGLARTQLALLSTQRGWLPAPRFALATEFPLGLMHAWTWIELDMHALVYPHPSPLPHPPPLTPGSAGLGSSARPGVDEFAGLRGYAPGDAQHSIHWKSLAKTGLPQVKQFAEAQSQEQILDFAHTPGDSEARLSLLTRWVDEAEQRQCPYLLRLPGLSLGPALGPAQRSACLKALALFAT